MLVQAGLRAWVLGFGFSGLGLGLRVGGFRAEGLGFTVFCASE